MKLIPLGRANDALCHFVSFGGLELLLDCGAAVRPLPPDGPTAGPRVRVELPALEAIDITTLDAILVSNPHSIFALPFLTEYMGFRGSVYATDMTKRLGLVLLEGLVAAAATDCMVEVAFAAPTVGEPSLATETSPTLATGMRNPAMLSTMFNLTDAAASIAKIQSVEFKEIVRLGYGVELTALSSGFSLGACLWQLTSPTERVAYVPAASGDLHRHPKELDVLPLVDCDTLVITDIRPNRDPHATGEHTVEQVLAIISRVIERGGVCILPMEPFGFVWDLIEAIDVAGIVHKPNQPPLPIFLASRAGQSIMDLTRCGAEWLGEKKVDKLYVGEPAFTHEVLRQNNVFHIIRDLSSAVFSALQHGGVIFADHPTLRMGSAPDLIRLYGSDKRNALVLTDPTLDPHDVLQPFYSLEIEKLVCPVDTRLSCGDVNQFIARCAPRSILIPDEYLAEHSSSTKRDNTKSEFEGVPPKSEASHFSRVFPLQELIAAKPKTELSTHSMKLLESISLEKSNKYIDGRLDPDLAARAVVTEVQGRGAATVSGAIKVRQGEYVVEPSFYRSPGISTTHIHENDEKTRVVGTKRKTPSSSFVSWSSSSPVIEYREKSSILLGQVDEEKLLKQLNTHDRNLDVYVSQGPDNADAMLSIPSLDARITLWKEAAKTLIETPTEETRALLLSIVLAQLHVIQA